MKTKNVTIQHFRKSIDQSPLRLVFFLISLVLACFASLQTAQALNPPPDGGYPNDNTAEGTGALFSLTTGFNNTAAGSGALSSDTDGFANTAVGAFAMESNTDGFRNVAIGVFALGSNTTGFRNTASGRGALGSNITGFHNTATGSNALDTSTTGNYNTASGVCALCGETTGNLNIALGVGAGENLTTENNNIDIGNLGVAGDANTIRIGEPTAVTDPAFGETLPAHTATFIAGISGVPVTGVVVRVSSSGQLGVAPSSARFKDEIKPMEKASEAILALKPVTFRYKKGVDPDRTTQFGLVAEQVEKVNPELVVRDADGKAFTVRYDAVNAMLLNEFLKEHCQVHAQERKIREQQSQIREQEATIVELKKGLQSVVGHLNEQDSKIQRVSARLELQTAPTQTLAGN
jgi:Chaperone of endosialidase